MKRREAIFSLMGAAGALGASPSSAQDLSTEAVGEMLRSLTGLEPLPGEAASVRAFLLSYRVSPPSDPGVEPATIFDPELGP